MSVYDTPTETCPYCGDEMDTDWVDNGIGMVQCGPYHCQECHASEVGQNYWIGTPKIGKGIRYICPVSVDIILRLRKK